MCWGRAIHSDLSAAFDIWGDNFNCSSTSRDNGDQARRDEMFRLLLLHLSFYLLMSHASNSSYGRVSIHGVACLIRGGRQEILRLSLRVAIRIKPRRLVSLAVDIRRYDKPVSDILWIYCHFKAHFPCCYSINYLVSTHIVPR